MQIKKTTEVRLSMGQLTEAVQSWLEENSGLPIPTPLFFTWTIISQDPNAKLEGVHTEFTEGWKEHEVV